MTLWWHSEGSGDITEDMEKQLQANSIRISILEEENSKLRASLQKLEEKSKQGPLQVSAAIYAASGMQLGT